VAGGACALLGLGACAVLGLGGISLAGSGRVTVENPYEGDFPLRLRGQLHAHSRDHSRSQGDPGINPADLRDKVEQYRDGGLDFVCMTDHNFEMHEDLGPYAVLPTRDPGVPGILFASGAEISYLLAAEDDARPRTHHIGGVGMGWSLSQGDSLFLLSGNDTTTDQAAIDSIRTRFWAPDRPALAIINHPEMQGFMDARFYPADLAPLHRFAAVEVYNAKWSFEDSDKKAWQHHGASHWDFVNSRGEGVAWGVATDDAHRYIFGRDFLCGWVTVSTRERSVEDVLDALAMGRFVASVDSCEGAVRDTTSAVFTELGVDGLDVYAASDRPSEFTWWSDGGHCIRTRTGVDADTLTVIGDEHYVRVRVRNSAGAAYSQPFVVDNPDRDDDRWRLRREDETLALLHLEEGQGASSEDAAGGRHPLLLSRGTIPAPEDWKDRADTTAYRDSLWGGWELNSVGTTPDEWDLDRDRSGYAVRCHGRDLEGMIPATEDSPLPVTGSWTLEWIGAITRRVDTAQPVFTLQGRDGETGTWRVEAAERDAPDAYRFVWRDADGGETSVGIRGTRPDEVHLLAVTVEELEGGGVQLRTWVDGVPDSEARARSAGSPAGPGTLDVFRDPVRPELPCFFRLRELRLTNGVRGAGALADDARRIGFLPGGEG
jgi:hypothetical protein